jgi:hypothetical protein
MLQRVCFGQTDVAQIPDTKKGYVNADIHVSPIIQNTFMDIVRFKHNASNLVSSNWPHRLLWADSRNACAKFTVSGKPNFLNYCVIFCSIKIIYKMVAESVMKRRFEHP